MERSSETLSDIILGLPPDGVALLVAEESARPAVERALAGMSCRVECADECASALERIAAQPPDLLLIDARRPGALKLCHELKLSPSTNAIPIILCGGAGSPLEAQRQAIDAGCDHWLPAELPESELRSRALHLLRARGLFRSLNDVTRNLHVRRDWVRFLVHDLRSPLTVLLFNLEFLTPAVHGSEELAPVLDECLFTIARMNAMLRDMLDIDRIQRSELKLECVRFDLAQVVHQAAADLKRLARARGLELSVKTVSVEDNWDRTMVERIVDNLLGNAIRYARHHVALEVERVGNWCHLRMVNDGPGIPAASCEAIFQPFLQLDGPRTGGAGLGLAFCRLAAAAHGGSIELEDPSDGRVCFRLSLPTCDEAGHS